MRGVGSLADDGNWLRWSDVVARRPIIVIREDFEVFGDDLLTARESVASTH